MKSVLSSLGMFIVILNLASYNLYSQLASSSWPMQGHDFRLSNSTLNSGPTVPGVKWTVNLTGQYLSGMAIGADGTLYINSTSASMNGNSAPSEGYLHAFNSSGTKLWTYTFPDGIEKLFIHHGI